jgi:acyl-CoA thioesterase
MTLDYKPAGEHAARWAAQEKVYDRSPIHGSLGLSLTVTGPGEVEVHYNGLAGATNNNKVVSGAALTAMIDSAVMQSVLTTAAPTEHASTIELKVNFLRPAPPGGALTATATVQHRGRRTAVGSAQVRDEHGHTVALGLVTLAIIVRETENFIHAKPTAAPATASTTEA